MLFNNFKNSGIDLQRLDRIKKGKPGSPCTKKYLCTNTEFTMEPICTASRKYQTLKIAELKTKELPVATYEKQLEKITEKVCLCEGLCSSTYQNLGILHQRSFEASENGFTISDELLGDILGKDCKGYLHFSPEIDFLKVNSSEIICNNGVKISFENCTNIEIEKYDLCLGYNSKIISNKIIKYNASNY